MYSENFITSLREIVSIMDMSMKIISVTTVDGIHTLRVCDVKHAQAKYKVTIDDVEYTIEEVKSKDKTISISGGPAPTITYFELYKPFFFHGTPRETATEISGADHANEITPMIFLNEVFEEEGDFDEASAIGRKIAPYIYALGQRPDDKYSKDLQELYVEPMRRLMENLIATMRKQTQLFEMMEYSTKLMNYAKFGVYVTNSGVKANLFAIPLAGCSNNGNINLYAIEECCEDKCKTSNRILNEDGNYALSENNDFLIQE